MFSIPTDCSPDSPVITVIDGLSLLSDNVGFLPEVVKKDVEVFIFTLSQANETVVQGKRAVPQLLQNGLKNDDIVKAGGLFE